MKIGSILILMVVTLGILAVPVSATYEIQNGTLGSLNGFKQDYINYTHQYGGTSSLDGIYFAQIEEYPSFAALKITTTRNDELLRYNTTSNASSTTAYLTDSTGRIVSTGIFGFNQYDNNLGWYIYYFTNSWNIFELTGPQHLILHYDNSKFDIISFWYSLGPALTGVRDIGFTQGLQAPTIPRIVTPYFTAKYFYSIEYTDNFINLWYLYKDAPTSLYYRIYIAKVFDSTYPSRIQVNITASGINSTVFDRYSNTDEFIDGLHPSNFPYYIDFIAKGGTVHQSVRLDAPAAPGAATWDLNVFTYDGSSGALYNGATVTKTDLTDPYYNGWGISGVDYPGRTDFQAIQGHEYNLSATAVGMSTGYANYTASTSPSIVKLYLYPDLGYSTLEFKVVDTGDRPITGLPVRLSDGRGKLTIAGFSRFNSTNGISYGWTVGDATTSQYVPQTGNVTATAGRTIIDVVMPLVSEIANLTKPTPSSPHAAAQEFMDFLYYSAPGLAMVAVVFLFLAMMGFNPAGMAGKRGGRRK